MSWSQFQNTRYVEICESPYRLHGITPKQFIHNIIKIKMLDIVQIIEPEQQVHKASHYGSNRYHLMRLLSWSPLASRINCLPGLQALLEVIHWDHSIGILCCLLWLVRTSYI